MKCLLFLYYIQLETSTNYYIKVINKQNLVYHVSIRIQKDKIRYFLKNINNKITLKNSFLIVSMFYYCK